MKLFFNFSAFAHETGTAHEEVPASVDPMLALGVVVFIAIGGIIIWKVLFSKKQTPSSGQNPPAKTDTPKNVQPSAQPEKLETKK